MKNLLKQIILLIIILFILMNSGACSKTEEVIKPSPLITIEPKTTTPYFTSTIKTDIDFSKFSGVDSSKKAWGVVMNTNGTVSTVPASIVKSITDYGAYYTGDLNSKKLYLIFSASYDNGNMSKVLNILKDNNIKSVFYLVGDFVRAYPDLVRRMLDEGHAIGNHSSNHECLPLINDSLLKSEVVDYHKYIKETFNYEVKHFMPPSGEYSMKVLALADSIGYTTQFWSIAYDDFDPKVMRGADFAFDKVIKHLHNGAFIFLHTVSFDNAAALDRILKYCINNGYQFDIFNRP